MTLDIKPNARGDRSNCQPSGPEHAVTPVELDGHHVAALVHGVETERQARSAPQRPMQTRDPSTTRPKRPAVNRSKLHPNPTLNVRTACRTCRMKTPSRSYVEQIVETVAVEFVVAAAAGR